MINFHSVSYILILPVEPPAQIAIPAVLCGQDGYFVELHSRVFNDCQLKIYLHKKKNIYNFASLRGLWCSLILLVVHQSKIRNHNFNIIITSSHA